MRSDISCGNISISDNTLHFDHSKILHNVKMRATSNFLLMFDDNSGIRARSEIKFIPRINYKTINVKIFDPEIRKKLLQNDAIKNWWKLNTNVKLKCSFIRFIGRYTSQH